MSEIPLHRAEEVDGQWLIRAATEEELQEARLKLFRILADGKHVASIGEMTIQTEETEPPASPECPN